MGMKSTQGAGTPVQRYTYATIGSRTERGGVVVSARDSQEGLYMGEHKVACVGDLVRYADGTESVIVSGAGYGDTLDDKPLALVGSHIANGDRVAASLQSVAELVVEEGSEIPGLLQPGFVLPPRAGRA